VQLAGSSGGVLQRRAALFAAHGYQALALGYFRLPGLRDYITRTPLEYFERAFTWARGTLEPANGFTGVCGVSRGAELGLLLGATFPELINAIIGYVPSVFTNGALNAGRPGEDRHTPCWTHRGQDLPVLCRDNPKSDWSMVDNGPSPRTANTGVSRGAR
jgi:hypothetical protein